MKNYLDLFIQKRFLISNYLVILATLIIAIFCWDFYAFGGLIPTPSIVVKSFIKIASGPEFFDNLFTSLWLTMKSMFYSILLSLVLCYIYAYDKIKNGKIKYFTPLIKFIMKCRYLTLSGLIFLFTLLTKDGSTLKISLLMFGIIPFFMTSYCAIIDEIKDEEFNLCTTLRMNKWQTLYEVVIVGKLDQVFEVIRQNFAITWLMITMVEGLSMSEGGLGTLVIKYNKYIQLDNVFAILIMILMIGILVDFTLNFARSLFFPYSKLQKK